MKVLNFGSLNLDYVYQVESILIPGETQASKDRKTFCGGKGLNQSIALAKAGIPVFHAGMIGDLQRKRSKYRLYQKNSGARRPYCDPGGQKRSELYSSFWRIQQKYYQRVCG